MESYYFEVPCTLQLYDVIMDLQASGSFWE